MIVYPVVPPGRVDLEAWYFVFSVLMNVNSFGGNLKDLKSNQ